MENIGRSVPKRSQRQVILSSLPLEVLLYFNVWFSGFFFLQSLTLLAYKAWRFYFPTRTFQLQLEISMDFLYGMVEFLRLLLASKGNKAEQINPLVTSITLAVPVALVYIYSLSLQTYVLRLDVILGVIGLVLLCCESLLGVATAISFHRAFRG